jgi:hypothetical protein
MKLSGHTQFMMLVSYQLLDSQEIQAPSNPVVHSSTEMQYGTRPCNGLFHQKDPNCFFLALVAPKSFGSSQIDQSLIHLGMHMHIHRLDYNQSSC